MHFGDQRWGIGKKGIDHFSVELDVAANHSLQRVERRLIE
jgi:hypothetical protein